MAFDMLPFSAFAQVKRTLKNNGAALLSLWNNGRNIAFQT